MDKNTQGEKTERAALNERAAMAKDDRSMREAFLADEKDHILRLTARISGRHISESDDEFSIALIAVNEAIDGYYPGRGDFFSYAAIVIRSRLTDEYRKRARFSNVTPVSPDAFEGNTDEESGDLNIQLQVGDRVSAMSLGVNNDLKDEIEALAAELLKYDISLSQLYDHSPRSSKTKEGCIKVIRAIYLPPPLIGLIKKLGKLPAKEISSRCRVPGKLLERHRKYLIAVALILDGDYPAIRTYVKDYIK